MKSPEATASHKESTVLRYVDYYATLSLKDFMDLVESGWKGGVYDISSRTH
jgi:hypothetical protein